MSMTWIHLEEYSTRDLTVHLLVRLDLVIALDGLGVRGGRAIVVVAAAAAVARLVLVRGGGGPVVRGLAGLCFLRRSLLLLLLCTGLRTGRG